MIPEQELQSLRKEMRGLRKEVAYLRNAWEAQKKKNEALIAENALLKQENKVLKAESNKLKEKLEATTNHSQVLQGMIFKPSIRPKGKIKKERGAQVGHIAHNRKSPAHIDQEKYGYTTNCPKCNTELLQSNSYYSRIVEDIAPPKKYTVTRYHVNRQWCPKCKREVYATPKETVKDLGLSFSRLEERPVLGEKTNKSTLRGPFLFYKRYVLSFDIIKITVIGVHLPFS